MSDFMYVQWRAVIDDFLEVMNLYVIFVFILDRNFFSVVFVCVNLVEVII